MQCREAMINLLKEILAEYKEEAKVLDSCVRRCIMTDFVSLRRVLQAS